MIQNQQKQKEQFSATERRRKIFSAFIGIILLAIVAYTFSITAQHLWTQWRQPPPDTLRIIVLDIGQGDALLIQTPQRKDILIDAGKDRQVLTQLGQTLTPWNRHIEYVIASHDDADHVGGMSEVTRQYSVGQWIISNHPKDTATSEEFRTVIHAAQKPILTAQAGQRIDIEQDIWLEILAPDAKNIHEDINDDSVVAVLRYKDFSLLLTGDASMIPEKEWLHTCLPNCANLNIDVLKVGHHGSKSSTSDALLDATTPAVALISVGRDNDYGHPAPSVLQRLEKRGIPVYRTDIDGRISCLTNGTPQIHCTTQKVRN